MSRYSEFLDTRLSAIADESGYGVATVKLLMSLPVLIVTVFTVFLAIPATRFFVRDMLRENNPVELLTFVFLLLASLLGLVATIRLFRSHAAGFVRLFYSLATLLLFIIAMEEISWGQQFFAMNTPDSWKAINAQNELTLHNVNALQDHLEMLPLSFGLLGILGVVLYRLNYFRALMPQMIMLPWFVVIAGISAIDLFQDYVIISDNFDKLINQLDEVIEMLIAMAAILFMWLQLRLFSQGAPRGV